MDRERLVRRAMHCAVALAPIYYLIPDDIPFLGLRRWVLLILFFCGITCLEAYRHARDLTVFGLRPHEKRSIASFVWAAAGITAALWLLSRDIASAVLVGMALVDPLAGELRLAKRGLIVTFGVPAITYLALCAGVLLLFDYRSGGTIAALSVVGAVAAVMSERAKVRHVDDDFVMIVLPGAIMAAMVAL